MKTPQPGPYDAMITPDGRYVGWFMYDNFTDSQAFLRDRSAASSPHQRQHGWRGG